MKRNQPSFKSCRVPSLTSRPTGRDATVKKRKKSKAHNPAGRRGRHVTSPKRHSPTVVNGQMLRLIQQLPLFLLLSSVLENQRRKNEVIPCVDIDVVFGNVVVLFFVPDASLVEFLFVNIRSVSIIVFVPAKNVLIPLSDH